MRHDVAPVQQQQQQQQQHQQQQYARGRVKKVARCQAAVAGSESLPASTQFANSARCTAAWKHVGKAGRRAHVLPGYIRTSQHHTLLWHVAAGGIVPAHCRHVSVLFRLVLVFVCLACTSV
ncbi:MAM and LDL-receptor class A domain-containing protein [Trichinella pseudospiralis]